MKNNYIVKDGMELSKFNIRNGSIYRKVFKNNKWTDSKLIVNDAKNDYTIIKNNNKFYIFSQNSKGDVILTLLEDEKINTQVILKNQQQTQKTYKILFNPIITKNGLTILYNTPSNDGYTSLMLQKIRDDGSWASPIKLDNFRPFKLDMFKIERLAENHIIIFYQNRNEMGNNLGYREIGINGYGKFNSFHTTNYQIIDLSTICTKDGIYMTYIIKGKYSNQLIFRKKEGDFSNSIVLAESQIMDKCLLFYSKNVLYLFYTVGGSLFYTTSQNNGDTFKTPQKYKGINGYNLIKAEYIQNQYGENSFHGSEIYLDKSYPNDIRLIDDINDDFYPKTSTERNIKKNNSYNSSKKDEDRLENFVQEDNILLEEINILKEKVLILQNRIATKEQELKDKDLQIIKLTKHLKDKSEEMIFLMEDIRKFKAKKNIEFQENKHSNQEDIIENE